MVETKASSVVCENCKPKSAEVQDVHQYPVLQPCKVQYVAMQACMRENGGSISICKLEWDAFSECFKAQPKP